MHDGWYRVQRMHSAKVEFHYVSANRDITAASRTQLMKDIGYVYTPVIILEAGDMPETVPNAIETFVYDYYPKMTDKEKAEEPLLIFAQHIRKFFEDIN